jgi:hypothetical protein
LLNPTARAAMPSGSVLALSSAIVGDVMITSLGIGRCGRFRCGGGLWYQQSVALLPEKEEGCDSGGSARIHVVVLCSRVTSIHDARQDRRSRTPGKHPDFRSG